MDATKKPLLGIWIGILHQATSLYIEIEYENLLAFCTRCNNQGHNLKTCRWKDGGKKVSDRKQEEGEERKDWVPKKMQTHQVDDTGGRSLVLYIQDSLTVQEPV